MQTDEVLIKKNIIAHQILTATVQRRTTWVWQRQCLNSAAVSNAGKDFETLMEIQRPYMDVFTGAPKQTVEDRSQIHEAPIVLKLLDLSKHPKDLKSPKYYKYAVFPGWAGVYPCCAECDEFHLATVRRARQ